MFPLKSQKLDSSIKRNTGFIRKLKKGFLKESTASLLKDLSELSLEKYMSEVIATVNEALTNVSNKNDEVVAAVEVVCALHQRFNERFTPQLFQLFLNNFANPEKEKETEKEELLRINRLKGKLYVLTELYLVGVFTSLEHIESKEALPFYLQKKIHRREPIIFSVLKEILNYRFKLGYTTTLATSFVKRYPFLFDTEDKALDECIYDESLKDSLKTLFKVFSDAVFSKVVDINKRMKKLSKEHQKCQIRTGKVRDEYIDERDILEPIFERFDAATKVFAEYFKLPLPDLGVEQDTGTEETSGSMITNQLPPPSERLWENDETKRFYENLPDIQEVVETANIESVNASTDQINSFFTEMETANSKADIDKLCLTYWSSGIDNKATRNRLLKFFIETKEWSKLNIYARFLATNHKYMPEITDEFVQYLDNGFRSQLHSNRLNLKNIMFYSEMMKFMLIPLFMVFHKIRSLIMNMQVPNNIEILTVFLEYSGKFLINNPETKPQMEKMVQLIRDKTKDRQLNINTKNALENIITLLYPPSVKSLNLKKKQYTPEQQFYRILIRSELSNIDSKHTIKLLRKAHWDDPAVYKTLLSLFTKPWKINYQNVPTLVKILNGLYMYHRNFIIKCIDQVLEDIERGLEINEYSENRHRIAQVRYLVEIYNMEMIKSDVLLEKIFQILKFGHPNNQPNPFNLNEMDLPDNYFRIQLITTILLNVRRFPATLNKNLNFLLAFFDYYIFTKDQPLPKETQFKVVDTFERLKSKSGFERSADLYESAMKLEKLVKANGKPIINKNLDTTKKVGESAMAERLLPTTDNIEDDDDDDDDENDDGTQLVDEDSEEENSFEDSNSEQSSSESGEDDSDEEESDSENESDSRVDTDEENDDFIDIDADRDRERRRMYDEFEKKLQGNEEVKVQDELERQFQQIMQESLEARKSEKVSTGKIPMIGNIPKAPLEKTVSSSSVDSRMSTESTSSGKPNKVAFTFLTKAGKKTQSRVLELPSNVKFVSNVLEEEEKLKNEREKIKKIVLQRSFD